MLCMWWKNVEKGLSTISCNMSRLRNIFSSSSPNNFITPPTPLCSWNSSITLFQSGRRPCKLARLLSTSWYDLYKLIQADTICTSWYKLMPARLLSTSWYKRRRCNSAKIQRALWYLRSSFSAQMSKVHLLSKVEQLKGYCEQIYSQQILVTSILIIQFWKTKIFLFVTVLHISSAICRAMHLAEFFCSHGFFDDLVREANTREKCSFF